MSFNFLIFLLFDLLEWYQVNSIDFICQSNQVDYFKKANYFIYTGNGCLLKAKKSVFCKALFYT